MPYKTDDADVMPNEGKDDDETVDLASSMASLSNAQLIALLKQATESRPNLDTEIRDAFVNGGSPNRMEVPDSGTTAGDKTPALSHSTPARTSDKGQLPQVPGTQELPRLSATKKTREIFSPPRLTRREVPSDEEGDILPPDPSALDSSIFIDSGLISFSSEEEVKNAICAVYITLPNIPKWERVELQGAISTKNGIKAPGTVKLISCWRLGFFYMTPGMTRINTVLSYIGSERLLCKVVPTDNPHDMETFWRFIWHSRKRNLDRRDLFALSEKLIVEFTSKIVEYNETGVLYATVLDTDNDVVEERQIFFHNFAGSRKFLKWWDDVGCTRASRFPSDCRGGGDDDSYKQCQHDDKCEGLPVFRGFCLSHIPPVTKCNKEGCKNRAATGDDVCFAHKRCSHGESCKHTAFIAKLSFPSRTRSR